MEKTTVQKNRTLTDLKPLIPDNDEPLLPLLPEGDSNDCYPPLPFEVE